MESGGGRGGGGIFRAGCNAAGGVRVARSSALVAASVVRAGGVWQCLGGRAREWASEVGEFLWGREEL